MIPLYTPAGQTCPLGFPMNQNRLAVPIWSYAMEIYPPTTIIELGTANGGFTTALGLHAWRIGAEVWSFDTCKCPNEDWEGLTNFLGIHFEQGDIFSADMKALIISKIHREGTTFLLCDNGKKPKEFNTFAKYLKPGDVIAAHDYWVSRDIWSVSEITKEDVGVAVCDNNLEPWMQEHFEWAAWLTYKKR